MKPIKDYIVDLDNIKDNSPQDLSFTLTEAFFSLFEDAPMSNGVVNAVVHVERVGLGDFLIEFSIDGDVIVPCDRCLGNLSQSIEITDSFKVRFGMDVKIGDELVSLQDDPNYDFTLEDGVSTFDLSWPMYELVVLAIPIQHIHPEGECDSEMVSLLQEHLAVLPGGNDEETEDINDDEDIDPRWNKLKEILNNN